MYIGHLTGMGFDCRLRDIERAVCRSIVRDHDPPLMLGQRATQELAQLRDASGQRLLLVQYRYHQIN
jgi:hypothetical protein